MWGVTTVLSGGHHNTNSPQSLWTQRRPARHGIKPMNSRVLRGEGRGGSRGRWTNVGRCGPMATPQEDALDAKATVSAPPVLGRASGRAA